MSTGIRAPKRALIVIDVQNEYFDGALRIEHPPREESVRRIRQAIDEAHVRRVAVVVVRQQAPAVAPAFAAGSRGAELHPLVAAAPATLTVTKTWPSAFAGTGLHEQLRRLDVDTITLVGYMLQNCVLATAFDGLQLGYRVEVLTDAVGTLALANREGSVAAREVDATLRVVLQSRAAGLATVAEWLAAVDEGRVVAAGTLVESAREARTAAAMPVAC